MTRYWVALLAALALNTAANLMMKFGVMRFKAVPPGPGLAAKVQALAGNWVLLGGLAFFACNIVFYVYALSGIRISVAYPIMVSAGFAVIALVAWRFLGETLSYSGWMGVAFIMAGVLLVARDKA